MKATERNDGEDDDGRRQRRSDTGGDDDGDDAWGRQPRGLTQAETGDDTP
jgi:hypothetical protein